MGEVVAWVVGVGVFVLGLGISIALHEVGHLLPAKRFGVKVTQYMVGFGPTLWSRRRGETEYGVKAIPLGGYVRMVGMYAPLTAVVEERVDDEARALEGDAAAAGRVRRQRRQGPFAQMAADARAQAAEEVVPGEEHRSFHRLPVGKRVVVMLGGPVVNLVIATVLLGAYITTTGLPQTTPVVSSVSQCVLPAGSGQTECAPGDPASPAAEAGLQQGDRIISVDGIAADGDWTRVQQAIRAAADRTVPIVVERGRQQLTLQAPIIPNQVARVSSSGAVETAPDGTVLTDRVGFLGVTPSAEVVPQPVTAVPGFMVEQTWSVAKIVLTLPQRMVGVAQAAFGDGPRDPNGPIGIVGVGRLSGEIASSDLFTSTGQRVAAIVSVLGSLNLALFVFNLVPLLPLDGGHVAGALWEGARRKVASWRGRPDPGPFDLAKLLPVTYAVTLVIIAMSGLLLYADVVRPITLG